jgi:AcrR family transcriptional regulator
MADNLPLDHDSIGIGLYSNGGVVTRRTYDNAGRLGSASLTRHRIIATTTTLLAESGYHGLSVAAVASAAAVSPQTIYNSIGGKGALLKACYDVTLAGDEDEVPMSQRLEFVALGQASSGIEFLARYAMWVRVLHERAAGILGPLLALDAARDAGAAEFLTVIERERRAGSTHAITDLNDRFGLPAGMPLEQAVDICWTLNSPELWARLVVRCGWTPAAFEAWLAGQLRASLSRGA